MPTSHNQTVDRTRLVLINVIITGYRFNAGEVIANELSLACQNEKGILAFPCIISALYRRAAMPAHPSGKFTPDRPGWTRKKYMHKMDVVDATPIRVVLPTPTNSPVHSPAAAPEHVEPSTPAGAQPSPAATPQATPATSPVHTPVATPAILNNRQSTPDSPLGSAPSPPPSPPPARSEEAVPFHILQLRSQLQ
ncbi:hypothetical protein V6N12_062289 [Hibiscus sabdariffa]|uniref:Uncharacterized protein n=1 Tax=Hibiscus sabdariffa TaxID=183260 RepID=A0ABR2F8J7_9ROSI